MRDEELREIEQRYIQQILQAPPKPRPPLPVAHTISHTELPEATSGGPGAQEWNYYRREVGRLLAEGHEGRWVLIKGEEIIGIWDTEAKANQVRYDKFLRHAVLIHQVSSREPVLRGPIWLQVRRS